MISLVRVVRRVAPVAAALLGFACFGRSAPERAPGSALWIAADSAPADATGLANLEGFYMPGRDRFAWLDLLGGLIVLGTIGGIAIHGAARLIARSGRRKS